jgi:GR25 family glycosyltransferase involved in LPS biosynthesis
MFLFFLKKKLTKLVIGSKIVFFMRSIGYYQIDCRQIGLYIFFHTKMTLIHLKVEKKYIAFFQEFFYIFQYSLHNKITLIPLKAKKTFIELAKRGFFYLIIFST